MQELRTLLAWNAKVSDPFFLAVVVAAMVALAMLFIVAPRLYLPSVLTTVALPKLFTIASYSNGSAGNSLNTNPGFSVVDMVLAAGIAAILFRRWRRIAVPGYRNFAGAMGVWAGSVVLSVFVGLALWSGTYRPINSVYAFRYLLTLASFAVAAQYGQYYCSERPLRKLMHLLAYAGNITIFLGIFYYFKFGSSGGGTHAELLFSDTGSLVYRNYLWFFDYAIDMGYFASMVAVLNVILLSDRKILWLRALNAIGLFGCVTAILLMGERVNILVLASAMVYFLWETSRQKHRSVRVSILFHVACFLGVILAFGATMSVIAPEFIKDKLEGSVGQNINTEEYGPQLMKSVGVPDGLAEAVVALPIGDLAIRLSLNVAGIWYFFTHPEGVGFWGQLDAAGFWSHHEIVTIGIEQGALGLAALLFFLISLKRLLWSAKNLPGAAGQLGVLLRATSFGLFVAMIAANTVLLDMKFALVYWSLVGVWSVIPRDVRSANQACTLSARPERVQDRAMVRI